MTKRKTPPPSPVPMPCVGTVKRVVMVGSGASSSVPKLGCLLNGEDCAACQDCQRDPLSKNHRLNPSLLIQVQTTPQVDPTRSPSPPPAIEPTTSKKDEVPAAAAPAPTRSPKRKPDDGIRNILIDCGKTFRESALRVLHPLGVSSLHCVVLTHEHADATLGLDDLREFSSNHDSKAAPISVYCDDFSMQSMKRVFPYLFNVRKEQSYVASLDWKTFESFKPFTFAGVPITPLPVEHGKNYICNAFAIPTADGPLIYLSDISAMPPKTLEVIRGFGSISCLIVDMLGDAKTPVHYNFDQAVEMTKTIGAKATYFTGVSHKNEYHDLNRRLREIFPDESVHCGFDGLVAFEDSSAALADGLPAAITAAAEGSAKTEVEAMTMQS